MNVFPDITELVPHAFPMLLLDRVISVENDRLTSELEVRRDGFFDDNGQVPAYVGMEYMAQTIAAYSGLQSRRRGEPIKLGVLLGTRKFESSIAYFHCGAILRVTVQLELMTESGMASFDCTVFGENCRQRARLSVYLPSDLARFLQGERD